MFCSRLLKYLDEKDISATFFVVGSRVVEKPDILREEYMSGHEISVHTWSHRRLTTLTTEQIVAELGFTREAIKQVLGVTPTTMRPPQGDIGVYSVTHAPTAAHRLYCLQMTGFALFPWPWVSFP